MQCNPGEYLEIQVENGDKEWVNVIAGVIIPPNELIMGYRVDGVVFIGTPVGRGLELRNNNG